MIKRKFSRLIKLISVILSLSIFFDGILFASGGNISINPVNEKRDTGEDTVLLKNNSLDKLAIPYSLGKKEKLYSAIKGKEQIIHLQDAHSSLSAQYSLSKILNNLLNNFDINIIFLEGSEGVIDTTAISFFPDEKIKQRTAEYLMSKGLVSAGEFTKIINKKNFLLYGSENSDVYIENVSVFRKIQEKEEELLNILNKIILYFESFRMDFYPAEVLELEHKNFLRESGQLSLSEYWKYIKNIIDVQKIGWKKFENIQIFARAIEIERNINFDKATDERKRLVDAISSRSDKIDLEILIKDTRDFKIGEISESDFHERLLGYCLKYGISERLYENLRSFTEYIKLQESIDIISLFKEFSDLRKEIKDILLLDRALELNILLEKLYSLRDIFQLKINLSSVELNNNTRKINKEEFLRFIRKNRSLNKVQDGLSIFPKDLDKIFSNLQIFLDFYKIAEKRNSILLENTLKTMRKKGEQVSVLITGGFHTTGLKGLFEENNISYLVVTPKWDKKNDADRPYIAILTNKSKVYADELKKNKYLALYSFFSTSEKIINALKDSSAIAPKIEAIAFCFLSAVLDGMDYRLLLNPDGFYRKKIEETVLGNIDLDDENKQELLKFFNNIFDEKNVAVSKDNENNPFKAEIYFNFKGKINAFSARKKEDGEGIIFTPLIYNISSKKFEEIKNISILKKGKKNDSFEYIASAEKYKELIFTSEHIEWVRMKLKDNDFIPSLFKGLTQNRDLKEINNFTDEEILSKLKSKGLEPSVKKENIVEELNEIFRLLSDMLVNHKNNAISDYIKRSQLNFKDYKQTNDKNKLNLALGYVRKACQIDKNNEPAHTWLAELETITQGKTTIKPFAKNFSRKDMSRYTPLIQPIKEEKELPAKEAIVEKPEEKSVEEPSPIKISEEKEFPAKEEIVKKPEEKSVEEPFPIKITEEKEFPAKEAIVEKPEEKSVEEPSPIKISEEKELPAKEAIVEKPEEKSAEEPSPIEISEEKELPAKEAIVEKPEEKSAEEPSPIKISEEKELPAKEEIVKKPEEKSVEEPSPIEISEEKEFPAKEEIVEKPEEKSVEEPSPIEISEKKEPAAKEEPFEKTMNVEDVSEEEIASLIEYAQTTDFKSPTLLSPNQWLNKKLAEKNFVEEIFDIFLSEEDLIDIIDFPAEKILEILINLGFPVYNDEGLNAWNLDIRIKYLQLDLFELLLNQMGKIALDSKFLDSLDVNNLAGIPSSEKEILNISKELGKDEDVYSAVEEKEDAKNLGKVYLEEEDTRDLGKVYLDEEEEKEVLDESIQFGASKSFKQKINEFLKEKLVWIIIIISILFNIYFLTKPSIEKFYKKSEITIPSKSIHPIKESNIMALDKAYTDYAAIISDIEKLYPEIAVKINSLNKEDSGKLLSIFRTAELGEMGMINKLLAVKRLGDLKIETAFKDIFPLIFSDDINSKIVALRAISNFDFKEDDSFYGEKNNIIFNIARVARDEKENLTARVLAIHILSKTGETYSLRELSTIIYMATSHEIKIAAIESLNLFDEKLIIKEILGILFSELSSLKWQFQYPYEYDLTIKIRKVIELLFLKIAGKEPDAFLKKIDEQIKEELHTKNFDNIQYSYLPILRELLNKKIISEKLYADTISSINILQSVSINQKDYPLLNKNYDDFINSLKQSNNDNYEKIQKIGSNNPYGLIKILLFDEDIVNRIFAVDFIGKHDEPFFIEQFLWECLKSNDSRLQITGLEALSLKIGKIIFLGNDDPLFQQLRALVSGPSVNWMVRSYAIKVLSQIKYNISAEKIIKVFHILADSKNTINKPKNEKEENIARETLFSAFINLGYHGKSYAFDLFEQEINSGILGIDPTLSLICKNLDKDRYDNIINKIRDVSRIGDKKIYSVYEKYFVPNSNWADINTLIHDLEQYTFDPVDPKDNYISLLEFNRIKKSFESPVADEKFYPLLNDPNVHIRANAAKILGLMKDPDSINALKSATNDTDENVRVLVAWALGQFDPKSLSSTQETTRVDAILKLADKKEKNPYVIYLAARALGTSQDTRVIPTLKDLLALDNNIIKLGAIAGSYISESPLLFQSLLEIAEKEPFIPGSLTYFRLMDNGPVWEALKNTLFVICVKNPNSREITQILTEKIHTALLAKQTNKIAFIYMPLLKEVSPLTSKEYFLENILSNIQEILNDFLFIIFAPFSAYFLFKKIRLTPYDAQKKGLWEKITFLDLNRVTEDIKKTKISAIETKLTALPSLLRSGERREKILLDSIEQRLSLWRKYLEESPAIKTIPIEEISFIFNIISHFFALSLCYLEIKPSDTSFQAMIYEKMLALLKIMSNNLLKQYTILEKQRGNAEHLKTLQSFILITLQYCEYFIEARAILDCIVDIDVHYKYRKAIVTYGKFAGQFIQSIVSKVYIWLFGFEKLRRISKERLTSHLEKIYSFGNNILFTAYPGKTTKSAKSDVENYFKKFETTKKGQAEEKKIELNTNDIRRLGIEPYWDVRRGWSRHLGFILTGIGIILTIYGEWHTLITNLISYKGLWAVFKLCVWSILGLRLGLAMSRSAIDTGLKEEFKLYTNRKNELKNFFSSINNILKLNFFSEEEIKHNLFMEFIKNEEESYKEAITNSALDIVFIMIGRDTARKEIFQNILNNNKDLNKNIFYIFLPNARREINSTKGYTYYGAVCIEELENIKKGLSKILIEKRFIILNTDNNIDMRITKKFISLDNYKKLEVELPDNYKELSEKLYKLLNEATYRKGSFFGALKAYKYINPDENIKLLLKHLIQDEDTLKLNPFLKELIKPEITNYSRLSEDDIILDNIPSVKKIGDRKVQDLRIGIIFAGGPSLEKMTMPIEGFNGHFINMTAFELAIKDSLIGASYAYKNNKRSGIWHVYADSIRFNGGHAPSGKGINFGATWVSPEFREKEDLGILIPDERKNVYLFFEKRGKRTLPSILSDKRVLNNSFFANPLDNRTCLQLPVYNGFWGMSPIDNALCDMIKGADTVIKNAQHKVAINALETYMPQFLFSSFFLVPLTILAQEKKDLKLGPYMGFIIGELQNRLEKDYSKELPDMSKEITQMQSFLIYLFDVYREYFNKLPKNFACSISLPAPWAGYFYKGCISDFKKFFIKEHGLKFNTPIYNKKIRVLIGIPDKNLNYITKQEISIMAEKFKKFCEILWLHSNDVEKNTKLLEQESKNMGTELSGILDFQGISSSAIKAKIEAFIEFLHAQAFKNKLDKDIADTPDKNISELRQELHVIMNNLFDLKKIDIEKMLARLDLPGLSAFANDNSVLGMADIIENSDNNITKNNVIAISDFMLQADPSLPAKIAIKQSSGIENKSKDVLIVLNPKVTRNNLTEYLKSLNASTVFDNVILYENLKKSNNDSHINSDNIVQAVHASITKIYNSNYDIILAGGEKHFIKVMDIVKQILEGVDIFNNNLYINMLENILKESRYDYEDGLSQILTKEGKLKNDTLARIKEKRTIKEEQKEYKKYIETHWKKMRDIIIHL
ncbi:conserved hypothetical protein, secreted [Candidatus Omnitrophus magneticus]|uniref:Uncharacterized protein n=1 Tax=Candidatus Omnitrophus magneticus TaxID=1609969 RepID=A0A0F0CQT8_9BACT|nr:conserved hypothetical protein, secreted [Candidatus Omnitrophus magneticus]